MQVGFIGLGSQGGPMAQMIAAAGFPLQVWARRAAALEPFAGAGHASSPAELGAACDLVGLCVVSDDDVREVAFGGGLLQALRPGAILAVHSTVRPDTCHDLADAAPPGVHVLDAPVSGTGEAALKKQLAVMVGGDAAAYERARPVFESFGSPVRRMGALGTGQLCKLVNNVLLIANLKLADDAMGFGASLGIDRGPLHDMLMASSGRSFALEALNRILTPQNSAHAAALLRKDLALAAEAANRVGHDLGMLSEVSARTIEVLEGIGK